MQLYRELELWSKDDIVPSDLQTVCRISAIKLKELQAENEQQADFLSLAKEEMDSLQAENTKLREALKKIENDWLTKSSPRERDYNELVAIASQALKEK